MSYNLSNPFPLTNTILCSYASFPGTAGSSPQTVKTYLSAVKHMHAYMPGFSYTLLYYTAEILGYCICTIIGAYCYRCTVYYTCRYMYNTQCTYLIPSLILYYYFTSSALKLVQRGMARQYSESQQQQHNHDRCPMSSVESIPYGSRSNTNQIPSCCGQHSAQVFGFLRLSEMTTPSQSLYDLRIHLCLGLGQPNCTDHDHPANKTVKD